MINWHRPKCNKLFPEDKKWEGLKYCRHKYMHQWKEGKGGHWYGIHNCKCGDTAHEYFTYEELSSSEPGGGPLRLARTHYIGCEKCKILFSGPHQEVNKQKWNMQFKDVWIECDCSSKHKFNRADVKDWVITSQGFVKPLEWTNERFFSAFEGWLGYGEQFKQSWLA